MRRYCKMPWGEGLMFVGGLLGWGDGVVWLVLGDRSSRQM